MFDRDNPEIVDLLMKCLIGVTPKSSIYMYVEIVDLLMKCLMGIIQKSSIS